VLAVSLVFAAMAATGINVPGAELARTLAGKLVCVVDLGADCDERASALTVAYGSEVGGIVAAHVPLLEYEEGMHVLPIDWRACREDSCADGVEAGRVSETITGQPVTLFSHVVDCRDPADPRPPAAECSGDAEGNLYLQYWAYYPDSRTKPYGEAGWHPDDWESFQVKITPDGVQERASSHHGYNGDTNDPINDTGWFGGKPAWSPATGRYAISSGSHAGRVGTPPSEKKIRRPSSISRLPFRLSRPKDVRVIPLETMRGEWGDYVGSTEHLPAWLKEVYLDPEATGTSG
jgi:hypothetical protein